MTKKNTRQNNTLFTVPLCKNEIRAIMENAGITSPSNKSIQSIFSLIVQHKRRKQMHSETHYNYSTSRKRRIEFIKALETAIVASNGILTPFMDNVDFTLYEGRTISIDWRVASEKLINKQRFLIKEKAKTGRRRVFFSREFSLVAPLIEIFENETGKTIAKQAHSMSDRLRSPQYDKAGIKFLIGIVSSVYPQLTNDSLRKDIARVLKSNIIYSNKI